MIASYNCRVGFGREWTATTKLMLGSQAANMGSETNKRTNAMISCDMAELLAS